MYFVGIDLAWSEKNNTAISIIHGKEKKGKLVDFNSKIKTNKEIVDFVCKKIKDKPALIAIDAPLVVKNQTSMREADKLITKLFRKYNAGTHPANRENLGKYGGLRGEELVKLFEEQGYEHNPYITKKKKVRAIIEVYPHPAIVVLFNLNKILQYKSRANRSYEFRWKELERFRNYIIGLKDKIPSLKIQEEFFKKEIKGLKGNALKEYEDFLDSIICAYIAYYYWFWGKEKCAILGSLKEGYIVTPIFGYMKKILREKQKKLW